MKYLYKYPQAAYPYDDLVATNRRRSRNEMEYELLDTGVFDHDRYFDVFVEYAKESPEEVLIRISAFNRGQHAAPLHILPTIWFRNTWSWSEGASKPSLEQATEPKGMSGQRVVIPRFGSEVVDVEVISTLGSFLRQVQNFNSGVPQKVKYRLKGIAFVDSPGTFKAPFDESGDIDLNLGGDVGKTGRDVDQAP